MSEQRQELTAAKGYFAAATLTASPQFDPIRETPAFRTLLADAEPGDSVRSTRFARPVESFCPRGDS